ncbi:monovalent cation/H(+) antiporter subunit G [Aureimonas sp. Leaf454]|uniref:monovalent cation/H(+) antiporter subunit G n=1 Tax=Aureimonas sp. Leaf454 TaxID=1736381 RepID=UPI0019110D57|nr:monovalent cation/H(+) antiporter subunit G [Aureimonas sp. Leaf454]
MTQMTTILAGLLALSGSLLALVAAIGLLRLPNFLARTHAASLVGSVGAGLLLLAVALVAPEPGFVLRALGAVGFLLLTTPLAAHLLARTAYRAGEASTECDSPASEDPAGPPDATK